MEHQPLLNAITKIIKQERIRIQLSQEKLAENANLDRTYISGVERNSRNLTINSLEKIISGLGLSNKEFIKRLLMEIDNENI